MDLNSQWPSPFLIHPKVKFVDKLWKMNICVSSLWLHRAKHNYHAFMKHFQKLQKIYTNNTCK